MLKTLLCDENNEFRVIENPEAISDILQHPRRLLWLDLERPSVAGLGIHCDAGLRLLPLLMLILVSLPVLASCGTPGATTGTPPAGATTPLSSPAQTVLAVSTTEPTVLTAITAEPTIATVSGPYDRAEDYSWIAGQLKQQGSCWVVLYVSPLSKSRPDQYKNQLALLPSDSWQVAAVQDGEWVIVQGHPEPGTEPAAGCTAHGYVVSALRANPNPPSGISGTSETPGAKATTMPTTTGGNCGATGGGASLSAGTWGGEHLGFVVSDKGAQLDFDCAHALVDSAILLDAVGNFDVAGSYVLEHGGPVYSGDTPADTHPARFSGSINGQTMTLTVTLTDTNEQVGRYQLALGTPPHVRKCL